MPKGKSNIITAEKYEAARKLMEKMRPKLQEASATIGQWKEAVESRPDLMGKGAVVAVEKTNDGWRVTLGPTAQAKETNGVAADSKTGG